MIDYLHDNDSRADFISRLNSYDFNRGKLKITTEIVDSKISDEQRALYWIWMDAIRKFIRESTEYNPTANDLHEYFKDLYLESKQKVIMQKTLTIRPSIMDLSVKKMAEYMNAVDMHCVVEYEFYVPTLKDLEFDAKRGHYVKK